jgi:tetratricopeptide (TPR) repeat protein
LVELKAATCPFCGGDLRLPEDRKVLKCMYCGKDIIVEEAIKKAGPTVDSYLALARAAKDAKNYKEAYVYYNKILELNPTLYEAWLGKAESAGWQSTVKDFRVQEVITNFENALKYCPEVKEDIEIKSTAIINNILVACFKILSNYMYKCGKSLDVKNAYYNKCMQLVSAWEILNKYDPTNREIIGNIIEVCKRQIEGVDYNPTPGLRPLFNSHSKVTPEYKLKLIKKMNEYIAKRNALDAKRVS